MNGKGKCPSLGGVLVLETHMQFFEAMQEVDPR